MAARQRADRGRRGRTATQQQPGEQAARAPLSSVTSSPGAAATSRSRHLDDAEVGGVAVAETPIRPASTMAATSRPLERCSGRRASSSIANMTPASGALKVAAMPAAPPAISSPCSLISGSLRQPAPHAVQDAGRDLHRRPFAAERQPAEQAPGGEKHLGGATAAATRTADLRRRDAGSSVAITCGMPEPAAPGAKRRVTQTQAAVATGIQSRGAHHRERGDAFEMGERDIGDPGEADDRQPGERGEREHERARDPAAPIAELLADGAYRIVVGGQRRASCVFRCRGAAIVSVGGRARPMPVLG